MAGAETAGGASVCKCGRVIPYEPGRRKQPRYCASCRSKYGGNIQRMKQRAARKKKRRERDGGSGERKA